MPLRRTLKSRNPATVTFKNLVLFKLLTTALSIPFYICLQNTTVARAEYGFLRSNVSFLSKDKAKNSRGAAEYFLLQVLGPGFVIVVAVVVAVTAQLHPVKVLVGWEEQGSRHTGGGGMADKGF